MNKQEFLDFVEHTFQFSMKLINEKEGRTHCFTQEDISCEFYPDCHYKQLKRLEQENEELKEKVNTYNCSPNCYKYIESNKYRKVLEEIRDVLEGKKDGDIDEMIDRINEVLNKGAEE